MRGPGLLFGQAEAVQQLEHAAFPIPHAETVLDQPAKVFRCPAADAVTLDIWAAQHRGGDRQVIPTQLANDSIVNSRF